MSSCTGRRTAHAQYVRNTAIVETVLEDASGNAVRITDFAPRFLRFERAFHPAQIIRRIEPLRGLPRIRSGCGRPSTTASRPNARRSAPTTCAMAAAPRRPARHDRCAALLHRP